MTKRSLRAISAITTGLIILIGLFVVPVCSTSVHASSELPVLAIRQILQDQDGAVLESGRTFQYLLTAEEDGCPLPAGAEEAGWTCSLTGNEEFSLGLLLGGDEAPEADASIRFSEEGLYHYRLAQIVSEEAPGVVCDLRTYEIYVKITQSSGLEFEVVWAETETGEKPDSLVFVNRIKAGTAAGDPPVRVVKRIEGETPTGEDRFVFVMTPERVGDPLPEGAEGSYEVSIYGEGEIEMGEILFTEPGTYVYHVSERKDDLEGYTYDEAVYQVVYQVKETEDGSLVCERQILMDEEEAEKCVFTNWYEDMATTGERGSGVSSRTTRSKNTGKTLARTGKALARTGKASARTGKSSNVKTGDETELMRFVTEILCALFLLFSALGVRLFRRKRDL